MALSPEKPSGILARQGKETDSVQNMRLNFADDPVYAHLATLSTAAAINGIEWEVDKGIRGREKLVAVRHRSGKRDTRRHGSPKERSAALAVDEGVKLHGRIEFNKNILDEEKRIFPYGIDLTLTKKGDYSPRQLISSEVCLIRQGVNYGVPALKIGIIAVHGSPYIGPKVEVINETAKREDFDMVLGLLKKASDSDLENDYSQEEALLTRTRPTAETNVTTQPIAHFDFHESLGVPSEIVNMGRSNFSVLSAYMQLPYELPDQLSMEI